MWVSHELILIPKMHGTEARGALSPHIGDISSTSLDIAKLFSKAERALITLFFFKKK